MSEDEFRQMMAAARAEFRAGLGERIGAIDTLWSRVDAGGEAAEAMQALLLAVHRIAGTAATFGESGVGEAAAQAESALAACHAAANPDNAAGRAECALRLAALRRAVDDTLPAGDVSRNPDP